MTKVLAGITTSVDGYIAGPNDGPGKGLGEGGERLHYWVFGGPWSYDAEPRGEPPQPDRVQVAEPEAKPPGRDEVAELLQRGGELEKAGNFEGAYLVYVDALQRAPGHGEATKRRDAARTNLVRTLDREATQAFQRQNLDLAIAKWDRVLELDPANRKARLERDRAADLKKRMQAKFGSK